jgi:hypothetical protein
VGVLVLAGLAAAGLRSASVDAEGTEPVGITNADERLPNGSGLIDRLPKDGSWVKYEWMFKEICTF